MAKTIDIANELDRVQTMDAGDLILGYSPAGNKHCYFPITTILRGGYACRRWNVNHSNPKGEAVGNLDYLRDLPSLLGLGCYLVDKNHGRRKLHPENHYKFVDGSPAKLDGSMGDYMWGWGTAWYYAEWTEGDWYYEAVGLNPIPGKRNYRFPVGSISAIGNSVIDRETGELVSVINDSPRYRGGNNDSSKDGKFNTLLGRVATAWSADQFGAAARKKGLGWEGYWFMHHAAISILTRIIFGNRDIQAPYTASKDSNGLYQGGLGYGVCGAGEWFYGSDGYGYYPFLHTSVGVELGDSCGVSSHNVKGSAGTDVYTANVPVFFGLKNFYGYMGRWGRGETLYKNSNGESEHWVCESLYKTYSMTDKEGKLLANVAPRNEPAGWLYIKRMSMNLLSCTPSLTGASDSTYYCDGYYNDNAVSAFRVLARGGNANNGGNAGSGYLDVDYGVTNTNAHYGSPLNFECIMVCFMHLREKTSPHGEKYTITIC